MKQRSKLTGASALTVGLYLLHAALLPSQAIAAQRPLDLGQVNRQVRQATRSLERDLNNGIGRLQKLAKGAGKIRDQYERAKELGKKADDASFEAFKAAKAAAEAAKNCQPEEFERKKKEFEEKAKEAEELADQAQKAGEKAATQQKNLSNDVQKTADAVNKHIEGLRSGLEEAFKAAEQRGLAETSVVVGNLRDAQRLLEEEIAKQRRQGTKAQQFRDEGKLETFNNNVAQFNEELKKLNKEGQDLGKTLEGIKERLKTAGKLIETKEDCSKDVGAAPTKPVDMVAFVDDRPRTLFCAYPEDDPKALGISSQPVADLGDRVIHSTTESPEAVEKAAKDARMKFCVSFLKPESDYCTIKAPLTAFRGHEHKDHHGHNHDTPDPPLDWGVRPPETVIRWEEKR
ncbi:MAG: hypothetical protein ACREQ7_24550 [Candidatus Binatia bacterium]